MSALTLWEELIYRVREAQVARDCSRNVKASQPARDQAVQALVTQMDHLLDVLDKMSERQILMDIRQLLAGRGRQ